MDFASELSAFVQILLIDISLAADNAIVVGLAAAGLPQEQRKRAILIGIIAATVLRILFAIFTVQLLAIVGLMLAGGLLLIWVSWKMFLELRVSKNPDDAILGVDKTAAPKTLRAAIMQILVADVSMSLDNVLAVAGAAREHMWVLVAGLAISVLLMGAASTIIVKLLHRFRWIGWAGLIVVIYVALRMIYDGWIEVSGKLLAP